MKNSIVKLVATGLYSGYSPIVSGTVGSIPPLLLAYYFVAGNQPMLLAGTVVFTILSVWSAGEAEKLFGHDSKKIVMDEWAGMFITLIWIPLSIPNYLIAFVVFRITDVIKVPPASQAEKLPRGWGVTMDDLVAGIQANIITQIVIYISQRCN